MTASIHRPGAVALGLIALLSSPAFANPSSTIATIRVQVGAPGAEVDGASALKVLAGEALSHAGFIVVFDPAASHDAVLAIDTAGQARMSLTGAPSWAPAGSTHHMGLETSGSFRLTAGAAELHRGGFSGTGSCFINLSNKKAIDNCFDTALRNSDLPRQLDEMIGRFWPERRALAAAFKADNDAAFAAAIANLRTQLAGAQALAALTALGNASVGASPVLREKATRIAAALADPRLTERMVALLSHAEPAIRGHAAIALAQQRDARARAPLLATLGQGDPEMKASAARALAPLGDPTTAPALIAALGDPAAAVRAAATTTLGGLGEASAIAPLMPMLTGDPDPNVRSAAAASLGELGATQAVPTLLIMVSDSAYQQVRVGAARGLGHLRAREAVKPLSELALKGFWDQRQAAIVALGQIGDPAAVKPLAEILENDAWVQHYDEPQRRLAAEALGRIGGKAAIKALSRPLENASEPVRTETAKALASARAREGS
jgi:HEAT repeat protein